MGFEIRVAGIVVIAACILLGSIGVTQAMTASKCTESVEVVMT